MQEDKEGKSGLGKLVLVRHDLEGSGNSFKLQVVHRCNYLD